MSMVRSGVIAAAAAALGVLAAFGGGQFRPAAAEEEAAPAFLPPYVVEAIARNGTPAQRRQALRQLRDDLAFREGAEGRLAPPVPQAGLLPRAVYSALNRPLIPGVLVWAGPPAPLPVDPQVRQAAAGQAATIDFWRQVFGQTLAVPGTVRFRDDPSYGYNNAFWNGSQMVFGDGDGVLFNPFTCCLDVVGHERMHGVTGNRLSYHRQSGALNESMSDVFGVLVVQFKNRQTAASANWLVGQGLFKPRVRGRALRDMQFPGTAYNDPVLGRDPQPAHMSGYRNMPDTPGSDYGGVHVNSGIPNRAFVLFARAMGGNAYGAPANIWYGALKSGYAANVTFAQFARVTLAAAQRLSGAAAATKLLQAWQTVGVTPAPALVAAAR
jgi:Zn-dependent metalloprotease